MRTPWRRGITGAEGSRPGVRGRGGGELVHAAGLGERHIGGPRPDAGTVFRIASMTKSFTAAAILTLRDDGVLKLEDLAEDYVPELRDWPLVSPDAARISIRHLLTMTAGFPTDDPWGDRQQGLPLQDFAHFLSKGVSFNCAPGTRFEYSNLGYASWAGSLPPSRAWPTRTRPAPATEAAGHDAHRLRGRGIRGSRSRSPDREASPAATGARRAGGPSWPSTRPGRSPRWAASSAACATSPAGWRALPPHSRPARTTTRIRSGGPGREMQLPQVLTGWAVASSFPGDGASSSPAAYGFGLFVDEHPDLGRIVSHSGGYPGFGSNMAWHPATGTGVIALGNSTYAAMAPLAAPVSSRPSYGRMGRPPTGTAWRIASPGPWPETLAAREEVSQLLRSWDDAAAQRLFSPNVAMDAPFEERRRRIALIRERIGEFGDDPGRQPEFDTPAHCRWWLAGERGTVQAQIQLNPERPPRVQSLTLAVPPAAGSALRVTLDAVVDWLNGGERDWPPSIPVADGVDAGLLARRLRMAAVWAGPCRVGAFKAGDGTASAAAELVGEHATITLTVVIDPDTRILRLADVAP